MPQRRMGMFKCVVKLTQYPPNVLCMFSCRAVGHKMYGSQYREHLSDIIRRAAEFCDCLQCFFVLHSMGGGSYGLNILTELLK